MHPYLFNIGSFRVPAYGVLVALGYLAGFLYLYGQRKFTGLGKEKISDLILWLILIAILGGKLLYIILFWNEFGAGFFDKLINIAKSVRYGFVFYGGLISAVLGLWIFSRKEKINFFKLADILSPALALGHAIGRLGCFFAGCCHGRPTDSVFGIIIRNPDSLTASKYLGVPIHPTQLYSSASNFLIFVFLHFILKFSRKRKWKSGMVASLYFALYSAARFTIEFFRGDSRGFFEFGLSVSQFISLVLFVSSISLALYLRKQWKKER